MSRTMKQDNTDFITLIMFYKKKKSLVFKVLSVVVCCFVEKYVCVDY